MVEEDAIAKSIACGVRESVWAQIRNATHKHESTQERGYEKEIGGAAFALCKGALGLY